MKRFLSIGLAVILATLAARADIIYRTHAYDVLNALPVNEESIVLLGDSIFQVGECWELFGENRNILDHSIAGGYLEEVEDNLDPLIKGKPKVVFLFMGAGELNMEHGEGVVESNLQEMLRILSRFRHGSPSTRLCVISTLPVKQSSSFRITSEDIIAYNAGLKELCETNFFDFIDVYDSFCAPGTSEMDMKYSVDGFHLNAEGVRVLADRLEPYIGSPHIFKGELTPGDFGFYHASASRASQLVNLPLYSKDVVLFGESLFCTVPWYELMPNVPVKTRGMGWYFAKIMIDPTLMNLIPVVFHGPEDPGKIVVYAGAGCVGDNAPVEMFSEAYSKMIKKIKDASPSSDIYIVSFLPHWNDPQIDVRKYNEALLKIAAIHGCRYLDFYSEFKKGLNNGADYFFDGELNYSGVSLFADLLTNDLKLQPSDTKGPAIKVRRSYELAGKGEEDVEILNVSLFPRRLRFWTSVTLEVTSGQEDITSITLKSGDNFKRRVKIKPGKTTYRLPVLRFIKRFACIRVLVNVSPEAREGDKINLDVKSIGRYKVQPDWVVDSGEGCTVYENDREILEQYQRKVRD